MPFLISSPIIPISRGALYTRTIECFSPIQCAQHILSGSAPVLTTDQLFVTRADTETLNPSHNKIAKVQPCPWTQTEKEAAEETDQDVREDHSLSEAIWPPRTPSEQGKCLPPVVSTLADSSRSHSAGYRIRLRPSSHPCLSKKEGDILLIEWPGMCLTSAPST